MSESKEEWQLKNSTVMERLCYIYNEKILTDIEVVVGPNGSESQESFHAHKFVLLVSSPIFVDLLQKSSDENQSRIFFPDISPRGFSNLLKYLYTDNIRFEDENEAVYTYQVAEKCSVPGLMEECQNYASELELSAENVCSALEASELLKVASLKRRCLKLMEEKTEGVLKSAGFIMAKEETIESILKLPSVFLISETELLESVILWGTNQTTKKKFGSSRHVIESFLPHIQFMSMTVPELARVMKKYGNLFSEREIVGLFMNISKPGSYELPSWCSSLVSRNLTKPVLPLISALPGTNILSFNLNCKREDNLCTPESFSVTLQSVKESGGITVTGMKLQFVDGDKTDSDFTSELCYEIYSCYANSKILEFEGQSTVSGRKEVTVKFVIPIELYSDFEATIQVLISGIKRLAFPRVISPVSGHVFPFRYSLNAPNGTFVISKLYYNET